MELKGKVAIVTGAGQGLGKAIALELAKAGADIVAADVSFVIFRRQHVPVEITGMQDNYGNFAGGEPRRKEYQ